MLSVTPVPESINVATPLVSTMVSVVDVVVVDVVLVLLLDVVVVVLVGTCVVSISETLYAFFVVSIVVAVPDKVLLPIEPVMTPLASIVSVTPLLA